MTPLVCHPTGVDSSIESVSVDCVRQRSDGFRIRFELRADLSRLAIARPCEAAFTDELWRHTCFEVFVAGPGESSYREFNLAPSGQWAVYRFTGYRQDMTAEPQTPIPITRTERDGCLIVEAWIPLENAAVVEAGVSAVIENQDGSKTYWALSHFGLEPDFHDRRGFLAKLS